jgi:Uma2 family endonuclease
MTTQTQRLTYEEYLKGPEIKQRYSIIDGVMKMAPAPTLDHQRILMELGFRMRSYVQQNSLGEVFIAPADVIIRRDPLRTRQPDILFVRADRTGILGAVVDGAPDLTIEILSPANSRRGIEGLLADYAAIGVRECWLISPEGSTVEVLTLDNGEWQQDQLSGASGSITSHVIPGFEIEVSSIFPPEPVQS